MILLHSPPLHFSARQAPIEHTTNLTRRLSRAAKCHGGLCDLHTLQEHCKNNMASRISQISNTEVDIPLNDKTV